VDKGGECRPTTSSASWRASRTWPHNGPPACASSCARGPRATPRRGRDLAQGGRPASWRPNHRTSTPRYQCWPVVKATLPVFFPCEPAAPVRLPGPARGGTPTAGGLLDNQPPARTRPPPGRSRSRTSSWPARGSEWAAGSWTPCSASYREFAEGNIRERSAGLVDPDIRLGTPRPRPTGGVHVQGLSAGDAHAIEEIAGAPGLGLRLEGGRSRTRLRPATTVVVILVNRGRGGRRGRSRSRARASPSVAPCATGSRWRFFRPLPRARVAGASGGRRSRVSTTQQPWSRGPAPGSAPAAALELARRGFEVVSRWAATPCGSRPSGSKLALRSGAGTSPEAAAGRPGCRWRRSRRAGRRAAWTGATRTRCAGQQRGGRDEAAASLTPDG
jgi:hypothetical protein